MERSIFTDYGAEIIERDGHYFIRYDAGEIVVRMEELPISEADAHRAQLSESDAYQVILHAQQVAGAR